MNGAGRFSYLIAIYSIQNAPTLGAMKHTTIESSRNGFLGNLGDVTNQNAKPNVPRPSKTHKKNFMVITFPLALGTSGGRGTFLFFLLYASIDERIPLL
jgi:hypothetical protein